MSSLTPRLDGYRDLELIAHGTTSLVFRATQERLNRTVAIKLLLGSGMDTGGTTEAAIARELETMVRLSAQPHIVSIIDTGQTAEGRHYTVMEYCEGGSYAQILSDRGPLPVDDVVEVGIAIGEALHAAHQAGIIHRDVKPSNILRSRFGPALADFGIARAPEELAGTLTREMMTPHHASPEALLHQAQSSPSDVYSLASTLWTLLAGHPPMVNPGQPDMDLYAFRDKVLHDPLPRLPRDDVPAWLVGELTRGMAKIPAQRHGTAREFADALRRGSLGVAAPAPGPAVVAPRSGPTSGAPRVHNPGLPANAWPASAAAALTFTNPPPATPTPVTTGPWAAPAASGPVEPPEAPAPPAVAPPAPPVPQAPADQAPPAATADPFADAWRGRQASPQQAPYRPPAAPRADPASPAAPRADARPVTAPRADPRPVTAPRADPNPVTAPRADPRPGTAAPRAMAPPARGDAPLRADRRPPTPPTDPFHDMASEPSGGWAAEPPSPTPPRPAPHETGQPKGRRGVLVGSVLMVALIAGAVAVVLTTTSKRGEQAAGGPTDAAVATLPALPTDVPASPRLVAPAGTGAPTKVKLTDRGTSVTVTWVDPSTAGTLPFAVSTRGDDGKYLPAVTVPAGRRSATVRGLDTKQNYCFIVTAIYSADTLAPAKPVCTTR
ncbi:protein kinase domain-containing protein [Luedemannella helvata]|uniref:non-specific serine/threonine protein kinase n=1 Tax=Luedemannella helvata TaxID=349315 RepID=A0ABN2L0M7_9ACTN